MAAGARTPARVLAVVALCVPFVFLRASPAGAQAAGDLTGLLTLNAGDCASGAPTGTWFRMVQPGGTVESGPFVDNTDSPCANRSVTPLTPGTDKGVIIGSYQPHPDPAFDATNGGTADRITRPQRFFGVNFAVATNPTDPQTQLAAPAPRLTHDGNGGLSGDMSAFAAAWNRQHFNQGAPKPDGSKPGTTTGPAGTYDPASGAVVLDWTSLIQGGPFNNFTGHWHIEGTVAPAGESPPPTTAAPDPPATEAPPSSMPGATAAPAPQAPSTAASAPPATQAPPTSATAPTQPTVPAVPSTVVGQQPPPPPPGDSVPPTTRPAAQSAALPMAGEADDGDAPSGVVGLGLVTVLGVAAAHGVVLFRRR